MINPLRELLGPKSIVGIEVGDGFIAAVKIVNTSKGHEIYHHEFRPIEDADKTAEELKGFLSEKKLRAELTVTAVPSSRVTVRELSFDFNHPKKLESIIKFQMESLVPYSIEDMLVDNMFGKASEKVVIEDFLDGIEVSVFILTDGSDYVIFPEAKDYKRIGDNDEGPNTGGMGSVSPVNFADRIFMDKVEQRIIRPTVKGLKEEGIDYKGFIFLGLINIKDDPYVIEYNVRMGDPESQVVIPRIENDFVRLLSATALGTLGEQKITFSQDTAVTVVMASAGYPGSYEKGKPMKGFENVDKALVFHAGTKLNEEGDIVTNGGRVIAVTGKGSNLSEAIETAYENVNKITWEGAQYRNDIGQDLLKLEK